MGTPRVQTDSTGILVETWSYYPFGEQWQQAGSGGNEHRFTGHRRDPETGDDYAGARYLTSTHGRWLSADPFHGDVVDVRPDVVGREDLDLAFKKGVSPDTPNPLQAGFLEPAWPSEKLGFATPDSGLVRSSGGGGETVLDRLVARGLDNPQMLNRYAYVLNDPVNFWDPNGLVNWWSCGLSVVGYVGSVGSLLALTPATGGATLGIALALHFTAALSVGASCS